MYDIHLHTHHSGDSRANPLDHIKRAKELGLTGICFTDHNDFDLKVDPEDYALDDEAYVAEILPLKNRSEEFGLDILMGIEMGLMPKLVERNRKLINSHPFDFVIGSVHSVEGIEPCWKEYYNGISLKEGYRLYFEYMLKCVESDLDFDTLAHMDYNIRYAGRFFDLPEGFVHADEPEIIEAILKTLIKKGRSLEVNTGGYRYGIGEPNPDLKILKTYYHLGGRMLTLGSDAHEPKWMAGSFDVAIAALKEIGFKSYTVYKNRKPTEFSL